jgi:CBS domain-containing protein
MGPKGKAKPPGREEMSGRGGFDDTIRQASKIFRIFYNPLSWTKTGETFVVSPFLMEMQLLPMKNFVQKEVEKDRSQPKFTPPPVTAYMTPANQLITFQVDTPIMEVVEGLLAHRITGAPVLDAHGKVTGLIDDKDCLRILFDVAYHDQPIRDATVENYTTNVMKTISATADVMDVANTFLNTKYKRLLVEDSDGKLVGQISRRDILRAIHDYNDRSE